jgi:hypothetical protein
MHNNFMCYRHRDDAIPPVIENEPFLIERLDTPEDVRYALFQVAARLACNRMELKRAGLLSNILQNALCTFSRVPKTTPKAATPPPNAVEEPASASVCHPQCSEGSASVLDCPSERSEESPYFAPAQPEQHNVEEPSLYAPDPFPPAELARRKEQELAEAQKEEVIPVEPPRLKFPTPPSCFAPPERWAQYDEEKKTYDKAIEAELAAKRAKRYPVTIQAVADPAFTPADRLLDQAPSHPSCSPHEKTAAPQPAIDIPGGARNFPRFAIPAHLSDNGRWRCWTKSLT